MNSSSNGSSSSSSIQLPGGVIVDTVFFESVIVDRVDLPA